MSLGTLRVLATDYDGTLAAHATVGPTTIRALEEFRAAGGVLAMVTGRELPQLMEIFSHLHLFEVVVAENGGLLYWPQTGKRQPLCEPPDERFVNVLRARQVTPLSVGEVIVATVEPHHLTVLEAIRDLGLELQIIFNKGWVMILPSGVTKASGLHRALTELAIDPMSVAGVGDAENDHAMLQFCGLGAAVANALPSLKDHADLVLERTHGEGVEDLLRGMRAGTLDATPRRPRMHSAI